jgi:hypothetical protein
VTGLIDTRCRFGRAWIRRDMRRMIRRRAELT